MRGKDRGDERMKGESYLIGVRVRVCVSEFFIMVGVKIDGRCR